MDTFQRAGIPVIAVDIPLPGATFFGADNYRAGRMAGEALGIGSSNTGTVASTVSSSWKAAASARSPMPACKASSMAWWPCSARF